MPDLDAVINDAISDADLPAETDTASLGDMLEATDIPDTPVGSEPTVEVPAAQSTTEPETPAPTAPAAPAAKPAVDDFEKLAGMPKNGPSGRENRIPYSRVQKISENAVKAARAKWEAEHLTPTTGKLTEYETKVKDYEARLAQVDQFEQIMTKDGERFLRMLSTVPLYKPFFDKVEQAFNALERGGTAPQGAAAPPADADMPQPDQKLSDGSMVYSMDGLKALLAWQANQVESRVTKQVEQRYKPIESEWQAQQRINSVIPQVRLQIEEARTWEGFAEHEDKVVKALQEDKRLSLEGAYRRVVLPLLKDKFTTDRAKIREEVIAELKGAPKATTAPTGSVKAAPAAEGPKSIEDIIKAQISTLKK